MSLKSFIRRGALDVYLIDGAFELFRHYYSLPSARDADGREIAAVRGVFRFGVGMITNGATDIAVATHHRIFPQRPPAWLQDGEGVEPELIAQAPLLEETSLSGARRR